MGRIIVFDAEVKAKVERLLALQTNEAGLIFGQHTTQKDIAVYLCPIPLKEDSSSSKASEGSSTEGGKGKSGSGKKSKSKADDYGIELDEPWICHYAKEIMRTLPGGFDILGLYIAIPTDVASKLQQKLRQVLFSIFKILKKDQELCICPQANDKVLLHICTVSKKFVCRTFDVSNEKSTPNPAEWKQLPSTPIWHTLKSELAVDLKFPVKSHDDDITSVKRQLDSALSPFFKNILNCFTMINGRLMEPSDYLDASSEGKKHKQKVQEPQTYNFDLLIPLEQDKDNVHSKTSDCVMMLTFKGTIHCRAFVHQKAIVQEAVQAIKQDVIRSIRARCEIHCEDLLVIEEEQRDPIVVYELPKRVFAPLGRNSIAVCDYQFHGDKASDSVNAFKELLDLDLTEDDIETCEQAPVTSDLIQPEVMEDRLSEFGDGPPSRKNVLFPVASAALAAVAAGLSYFLLLQDS